MDAHGLLLVVPLLSNHMPCFLFILFLFLTALQGAQMAAFADKAMQEWGLARLRDAGEEGAVALTLHIRIIFGLHRDNGKGKETTVP